MDRKNTPFYEPHIDQILVDELKRLLQRPQVEIIEIDAHLEERNFATLVATTFHEMMSSLSKDARREN